MYNIRICLPLAELVAEHNTWACKQTNKECETLIIGVCILSRVYQLNIRTPPYATYIHTVHTDTNINSLTTSTIG
jgi:hypothetical protein